LAQESSALHLVHTDNEEVANEEATGELKPFSEVPWLS